MFKWLGNSLLIIALLTGTNSEWFLFQSVAWASMIVRYSQKAPLEAALVHTFDGKHPCCLCKAIAAARKAMNHKGKKFPLPLRRLEFLPASEEIALAVPAQFRFLPTARNSFAESLPQRPPKPPPRGFFV